MTPTSTPSPSAAMVAPRYSLLPMAIYRRQPKAGQLAAGEPFVGVLGQHVGQLVADDGGELILVLGHLEQAAVDPDLAAGQGEGVDLLESNTTTSQLVMPYWLGTWAVTALATQET